jgi:hypothetical protein
MLRKSIKENQTDQVIYSKKDMNCVFENMLLRFILEEKDNFIFLYYNLV